MIDKIKAEIEKEIYVDVRYAFKKCLKWAEEREEEFKKEKEEIKNKIGILFHREFGLFSTNKEDNEYVFRKHREILEKAFHSRRTKPVFQPMGNEGTANPLGQDKNSDTFKGEAKT